MGKKQKVFQDYIVPASDFLVLSNRPSLTLIYPVDHAFSKAVNFDSMVRMIVLSDPDYAKYVLPDTSEKERDRLKPRHLAYLDINSIRHCRFKSVGQREWDANYGPIDPHAFLSAFHWGPYELDNEVKVFLLKWANANLNSLNNNYGFERQIEASNGPG